MPKLVMVLFALEAGQICGWDQRGSSAESPAKMGKHWGHEGVFFVFPEQPKASWSCPACFSNNLRQESKPPRRHQATKQPTNPIHPTTNPSSKPSTKSWESWQVPFNEVISKHVQLDQHVSVLAKVRGKTGGQLGNGLCRPGFVICWYGWNKVFWIQKRWNNAMILFVWSWHPSKKVLKYCLINIFWADSNWYWLDKDWHQHLNKSCEGKSLKKLDLILESLKQIEKTSPPFVKQCSSTNGVRSYTTLWCCSCWPVWSIPYCLEAEP